VALVWSVVRFLCVVGVVCVEVCWSVC
jgi:hypothetical protein